MQWRHFSQTLGGLTFHTHTHTLNYFSQLVIVMCDRQLCKTSILSALSTIMTTVQTAFWAYR